MAGCAPITRQSSCQSSCQRPYQRPYLCRARRAHTRRSPRGFAHMCLAIPAQVVRVDAAAEQADVMLGEVRKTISTALLESV
ncbi:MAG: HypC/HybG/HupF family hydrogenase formation chaperone, partial [Alphaproteobacteria bacterium]